MELQDDRATSPLSTSPPKPKDAGNKPPASLRLAVRKKAGVMTAINKGFDIAAETDNSAQPHAQSGIPEPSSGKPGLMMSAIKSLSGHHSFFGKSSHKGPRRPLPPQFQDQTTVGTNQDLVSMSDVALFQVHLYHCRQSYEYLEEIARRRDPQKPDWTAPGDWKVSGTAAEEPPSTQTPPRLQDVGSLTSVNEGLPEVRDVGSLASVGEGPSRPRDLGSLASADESPSRLRDAGSLASIVEGPPATRASEQTRKDSATQRFKGSIGSAGRRSSSKVVRGTPVARKPVTQRSRTKVRKTKSRVLGVAYHGVHISEAQRRAILATEVNPHVRESVISEVVSGLNGDDWQDSTD
ncbi:hypothetical protein D6D20_02855 [Aureobasidium pullulans]|uniref:Uncharacterized protein n=1 Tax=Aureobasidium pullulans TaxID=5580 RepID=A0A4S9Z8X8_AURPU|nr:hypothetical protein D6D20_02855 [Aureobasidium pullulans]TIA01778.1 hypothetical protein D6C82_03392 [Aureobasidium pullulans]